MGTVTAATSGVDLRSVAAVTLRNVVVSGAALPGMAEEGARLPTGVETVPTAGSVLAPGTCRLLPSAMPPAPAMEFVIIPRTAEISAAEDALRWALVAFFSGQRANISLLKAGTVVANQVPQAEDNFTLHRSWPAYFLLVCSS